MSTSYTERLFYVVKESDTTYSLYSIQTDHLILAEVAANAISDFLFLNEPNNPALSHLETTSHYFYDSNSNSKGAVNYYTTLSTYEPYDHYDPTEVTQWGNITLNNLTLDDSHKQLSFNFSSGLEEKCEDILTNFVANPDKPDNAAKANRIITNSINRQSELYIHTGKTDGPKTQYSPNSEWKDLNIDDD